jgi:hypothetical protein
MILVLGNFAGVFSNLLKLLNWSIVLKENDILLFYYTNKKEHNENGHIVPFLSYGGDLSRIIFYKYFEFPKDCSIETFLEDSRIEMFYPPESKYTPTNTLYFQSDFPLIRQTYYEQIQKRLHFTSYMKSFLENEVSLLRRYQAEGKRILAVYLRSNGHFIDPFNIDTLFQEIHSIAKEYDYVVPITQIQSFFDRSKEEFQEKILSFPRNYLQDDVDWKKNVSDEDFEQEFRLAIQDVYLASQCDFILGGPSNMLLGSLFLNPTVSFKIFDELKNREVV